MGLSPLFLHSCTLFTNSAPLLFYYLSNALRMLFKKVDVLDIWDVLSLWPTSSFYSIQSCFGYLQCPGSFVDCPTGARLECIVLNEVLLSLSGLGCLCVSIWSSVGLLPSITISPTVLYVGYLGRFVDFYNKYSLSFKDELCISCLIRCSTK